MIYLEYAATNPFTKYPCSKYGQFLNPNANYAYKERKVLMDCDERIKAAIGAKDGHVLYFRCATDALEWLHSEGNKCMIAWAHSPYEHDAAVFGIESKPDELVGVDFYCHQLVNQLTGQIHNIKGIKERIMQCDVEKKAMRFLSVIVQPPFIMSALERLMYVNTQMRSLQVGISIVAPILPLCGLMTGCLIGWVVARTYATNGA